MSNKTGFNIVKMTFNNGANLPTDLIIQTEEFDERILNEIADKVAKVMLNANNGVGLDGFVIPDNWYAMSFIDKLECAAKYLGKEAYDFTVLPYTYVQKNIPLSINDSERSMIFYE